MAAKDRCRFPNTTQICDRLLQPLLTMIQNAESVVRATSSPPRADRRTAARDDDRKIRMPKKLDSQCANAKLRKVSQAARPMVNVGR
jgi:hypothetical protein